MCEFIFAPEFDPGPSAPVEEWRQVFDTKYRISSFGKVRSDDREMTISTPNSASSALTVSLTVDGKRKTYPLKKLVAQHFPIKVVSLDDEIVMQCDTHERAIDIDILEDPTPTRLTHIDGDRNNCAAHNLIYNKNEFYKQKETGKKAVEKSKPAQTQEDKDWYIKPEDKFILSSLTEWLPIRGFPGYSINPEGKIRNSRTTETITPRFCNASDKHLSVRVYVEDENGKQHRKSIVVPQAVIETFDLPNCTRIKCKNYQIMYRDDNPMNCNVNNLFVAQKLTKTEIRDIERKMASLNDSERKSFKQMIGLI